MTDELKPCPFCGGDAMTCFDDERMIFRHSVECIVCGGRSGWYSTKEVAATAWNARAAVTDEQFSLAVHDGRVWQKVRTCENVLDHSPCAFECSECGFSVRTVPDGPADWQTPFWRHCPNCGAKVVG